MRLARLDLIRYGKFTGRSIHLPRAAHDFHVVVGVNEAGKSTLRSAIRELLFGIAKSPPMAFLHPMQDLRLGGLVETGDQSLDFHRAKANRSPLRTPADEPLPDDALAPFLADATMDWFVQMYGLDHGQLVAGSQRILDASNNVGQVLFQSAAGVAGLAPLQRALDDEADTLWGPRAKESRQYTAAERALREAEIQLKDSVLRAKSHVDKRSTLDAAHRRLDEVQAQAAELEERRARLERVRRLAPRVQQLRARRAELEALGAVLDLPADAGRIVAEGQMALATAAAALHQREQDVARLDVALADIAVDDSLLARAGAIADLEAFRHRVRDHAADLAQRHREVGIKLSQAASDGASLGWPVDEAALRTRLPSTLALHEVDRLLKERGALDGAVVTARQAVAKREIALVALEAELAQQGEAPTLDGLHEALTDAQTWRASAQSEVAHVADLAQARQALDQALAGLGRWTRDVEALARLTLPTPASVAEQRDERIRLGADLKTAHAQMEETNAAHEKAALAVEHYAAAHGVVTADEVRAARVERNAAWSALKDGSLPLSTGAPTLDAALQLADRLVDAQLDSATEAAELQSLRQRREADEATARRAREMLARRKEDLSAFDAHWARQSADCGLDGLPLVDVAVWLTRRDHVLATAGDLHRRERELSGLRVHVGAALVTLNRRLAEAGQVGTLESLAAACAAAEHCLSEADRRAGERRLQAEQARSERQDLEGLRDEERAATARLSDWQSAWMRSLAATRLDAWPAPSQAEAAVLTVDRIARALADVDQLRSERIGALELDLASFVRKAAELAEATGETIDDVAHAERFSQAHGERLQAAQVASASAATTRSELNAAQARHAEAREAQATAQASLAPLLARAGVADAASLVPLVERSDRRRALQSAIDEATAALESDADALDVDAVLAEVDAANLPALPAELARIGVELPELRGSLTTATEARMKARQDFEALAGQADGATAEARRQEALATMADVTERWLKVATASRLLKWSVDRYRDRRQGPMLTRAGEIFGGLTLGRYGRLSVDYDAKVPALLAVPASGASVGIEGLSEGTRDQLYLALRLAALELHLEKASPLPFIADDLFINFDDARSRAGLAALRDLSTRTQVIFLTHHVHLLPHLEDVFGQSLNVVELMD